MTVGHRTVGGLRLRFRGPLAVIVGVSFAAAGFALPRAASAAPAPPPVPVSVPVPLIVDTDAFSSTDDVAAVAMAFAFQLRGEATVLAIGVSTRTNRPAVSTDSWRCVAAIAQFYGARSVPIGTSMPNEGTEKNVVDWAGPCARLAAPATPAPEAAVTVYRRALAAQPDASVVMVSTGYLNNLAALLASPPDSNSSLDGRALVAKKVKMLVSMGGGYPSRAVENNLSGDPVSAQIVARDWPTRLVWSGYEVGDLVHTGQTISSVHPASSPVRVAYEAFVGPDNWMYSYDETALYHAVRPSDPLLKAVGPGANAVHGDGGNTFTPGGFDQYYLTLAGTDVDALNAAIESLLDTLPGAPSPAPTPAAPPAPTMSSTPSATPSTAPSTLALREPATAPSTAGTTACRSSKSKAQARSKAKAKAQARTKRSAPVASVTCEQSGRPNAHNAAPPLRPPNRVRLS